MKRSCYFLSMAFVPLLCLSLIFFSGMANAAAEGKAKGPKYVALFGHPYSAGDPYELGARKFKELVEKRTEGKMEIQIFPASQLG